MSKTITLENASQAQCEPSKETIENILNFSKAFRVLPTRVGIECEIIQN